MFKRRKNNNLGLFYKYVLNHSPTFSVHLTKQWTRRHCVPSLKLSSEAMEQTEFTVMFCRLRPRKSYQSANFLHKKS